MAFNWIEQLRGKIVGIDTRHLPLSRDARGENFMTLKKAKGDGGMVEESGGRDNDATIKPAKSPAKMGRPKQNPHAGDKKLTIRVPADLHRKLRYASVDLDKPMVEIAVDALIAYLAKHEG